MDLEEKLKKEFEAEKAEMEEKFRERLGQVKEEFAKELQLSTQDMVDTHRKELGRTLIPDDFEFRIKCLTYSSQKTLKRPSCRRKRTRPCRNLWNDIAPKWPPPMNESSE